MIPKEMIIGDGENRIEVMLMASGKVSIISNGGEVQCTPEELRDAIHAALCKLFEEKY